MKQHSSDVKSLSDWPIAILAGGRATRLRPITQAVPKALLEVAGEPFLAHQLRLLERAGFRQIVLCVGYLAEQIEEFAGDGSRFGVRIRYVRDGEALRGTGGAIRHALDNLGEQFLVLYGDSYLPISYEPVVQAFVRSRKPALMTIFRNNGHWDQSNIWFEAGQLREYNKREPSSKMEYIEYGLSVLDSSVFERHRDLEVFDLADLYQKLVENGEMAAFEVKQRFYEIGSPTGLKELDHLLRQRSLSLTT